MTDAAQQLVAFRRYGELVRTAMTQATSTGLDLETEVTIQVERGDVFAGALLNGYSPLLSQRLARLIDETLADAAELPRLIIVDRAGHRRPAYRGLLIYSWLQTYQILYESLPAAQFSLWEEPLRAWCDVLEADTSNTLIAGTGISAARGSEVACAGWNALALSVAGQMFHRDAWTDLAADTFGRITRSQQTSGAFFTARPSDNPEVHWFDELVLLHAMASFAVQREDRIVAAAVQRATEFHLRETQPDHATNDPWALFAFIWNPATHTLADQLLHTATVQQGQLPAGVSLMLLADALYCLQLFQK